MAGAAMNRDYLAAVGVIVIVGVVMAWVWIIAVGAL